MRRLRLTATALAAAAATISLPAPADANSFHVACASSHVAHDDPIVFPGRAGASHRHEFFGSRAADARATTRRLELAPTTCAHSRDTAAYWAPTLEVRGVRVTGTMRAYYQRAGKARAAAPPRGLRVIAGDPHARVAQPMRVTSWQCVGRGRTRQHARVPACARGERLSAWIRFPDCWDGRHLDSSDHRRHLAYARRGACPRSHPVELMRLATLVTWPVRPRTPSIVTLAGGALGPTGMHADFWNSWHQPTLRQLRWDCLELAAPCGALSD